MYCELKYFAAHLLAECFIHNANRRDTLTSHRQYWQTKTGQRSKYVHRLSMLSLRFNLIGFSMMVWKHCWFSSNLARPMLVICLVLVLACSVHNGASMLVKVFTNLVQLFFGMHCFLQSPPFLQEVYNLQWMFISSACALHTRLFWHGCTSYTVLLDSCIICDLCILAYMRRL